MFVQGLIVKRGRTATGRSQALYPSPEFLTRWNSFAYRADQLVRAAAQLGSAAIFFESQPSAFSRIIADTSSGAFIASLRRSLICGEASSIIPKPTSSFFEGVSSSCRQGTSLACRLTIARRRRFRSHGCRRPECVQPGPLPDRTPVEPGFSGNLGQRLDFVVQRLDAVEAQLCRPRRPAWTR
jgi:hypothetical protein